MILWVFTISDFPYLCLVPKIVVSGRREACELVTVIHILRGEGQLN